MFWSSTNQRYCQPDTTLVHLERGPSTRTLEDAISDTDSLIRKWALPSKSNLPGISNEKKSETHRLTINLQLKRDKLYVMAAAKTCQLLNKDTPSKTQYRATQLVRSFYFIDWRAAGTLLFL